MGKYKIIKDLSSLYPSLKVGVIIDASEILEQGQLKLGVNKINGKILPRMNKRLVIQSIDKVEKINNEPKNNISLNQSYSSEINKNIIDETNKNSSESKKNNKNLIIISSLLGLSIIGFIIYKIKKGK